MSAHQAASSYLVEEIMQEHVFRLCLYLKVSFSQSIRTSLAFADFIEMNGTSLTSHPYRPTNMTTHVFLRFLKFL